ncbi:unnamed protein product [Lactuca saligna]|uniref:Alcohol dehydrogenase-like C-terminal domain-containing protein n=1 Tax=Lactuca saligna TaxID=75948 RepID=A0AA35W0H8_LACSI|nr:unnamed protein product [Lactuca saligna]
MLVKGLQKLKHIDLSISYSFTGFFLKNLSMNGGGDNLEVMILRDCMHLKEIEVERFMAVVLAGEFKHLKHLVAQGAKIRGATRIIGVDTNLEKKEKSKAFGVIDFINPNDIYETVQQAIKRLTDSGVDYSFECIGDIEMINTTLHSCCDGWGVTNTLGVPKTNPNVACHYELFLTGRTLKGSLFGGWKPKSDIPRSQELSEHGFISLKEL